MSWKHTEQQDAMYYSMFFGFNGTVIYKSHNKLQQKQPN